MSSPIAPSAFSSTLDQRKQDISVCSTDFWQQKQCKSLLPSLQQALCSTGPRIEWERCTHTAATALRTRITGAEDGSDLHVQTSRAALHGRGNSSLSGRCQMGQNPKLQLSELEGSFKKCDLALKRLKNRTGCTGFSEGDVAWGSYSLSQI